MDLETLKARARDARRDTYALYLACRDPRVHWYAKIMAGAVLAYALSPIDLIPDFIPILGYVDDLILIPAGIIAVRKMIPARLFSEHRQNAQALLADGLPHSRAGALVIVGLWLFAAVCIVWYVWNW